VPPPAGPGEGDGGSPEDGPGIPQVPSWFSSPERALKKAVEDAFRGVDFAELEAAWKNAMVRVSSK
jgi:hypothetical protein